MLFEKYEPKTTEEILGNKLQTAEIKNWLKKWKKGSALLLHGPSGTGKTLAIRLLAKELDYEAIEKHHDDTIDYAELKKSSLQKSLFLKSKIILLEAADAHDPKLIISLIGSSEFPVILTAESPYGKLNSVRKMCTMVKFDKVRPDAIMDFLKKICSKEKILCDEKVLRQYSATGDVRAALTDLEAQSDYRDITENIFNAIRIIFKATSLESAKIAMENSENTADIFSWLAENVSSEYEKLGDLASAYEFLAKADLFRSRIIRRQAWGLQKYFFDISVFGVVLSKSVPSRKFVMYRPPFFRKHAKENHDLENLARQLHCSRKEAADSMRLMKIIDGRKLEG